MRNTMIAAAALAGLTAVPNVGQAEGYSYGNAFLVTAGVGVPASVGDYGEDTDPKFSIPINVTGPIHKRRGWIASYSFNRLKPAGGDLADCQEAGTCVDITVHHFGAGPMVTMDLGKTHLYVGIEAGADSVGPYERGGERNTYLSISPAAALAIPIASSPWSAVVQFYSDTFRALEDDGSHKWKTYLTPSVAVGYSFGRK